MDGSADEPSDRPTLEDVEAAYDFESFGPTDLAEMTPEEWEVAFDPTSWVVGETLLDRVEIDLRRRIAEGDVFAVLERIRYEGDPCLVAYSDEDYALVRPDGSVEGFGTVMRDVKPTVAVCSIPDYDPEPAPPGSGDLPDPTSVADFEGDLGNRMLQVIGFAIGLSGLVLLGGWLFVGLPIFAAVVGVGFLLVAFFLLFVVANARLSARYRAEAYRDRLRAAGVGTGERPSFVPRDDAESGDAGGTD